MISRNPKNHGFPARPGRNQKGGAGIRDQRADGSTQMTQIIFDFRKSSVDLFYLFLCVNP